ncbi:MAG: 16S rRNA (cytidine(1402)-2'-O)-methyltransferase [Rhodospirillaceae bacterium]|nr:16S rRNA (cytidine(1402)-2'-O)-methyltransferase [Rhodospirillaceae bacterium]
MKFPGPEKNPGPHTSVTEPSGGSGASTWPQDAIGDRRKAGATTGTLAIVATPIGNLGDITRRAIETLAAADLVLCEDTRVTGRLLSHLGLKRPLRPYHDHNAARMRPEILQLLAMGQTVALVSDAGTPLISDPGYRLVRDAIAAGHTVTPLPGASALLAALAIAGLPTDRFLFAGFLPPKSAARRTAIAELRTLRATLLFYESGPRLAGMLADLADLLGPREAAVARELTKLYEETKRDRLDALAAHYAAAGGPKGEIVVLVGPPDEDAAILDDAALDAMLTERLARLPLKTAVDEVAGASGRPRREVYRRALALRDAT